MKDNPKNMIPVGAPKWIPSVDPKALCPRCIASLCEVEVMVLMDGHKARSSYLGCPACSYQSQALIELLEGSGVY